MKKILILCLLFGIIINSFGQFSSITRDIIKANYEIRLRDSIVDTIYSGTIVNDVFVNEKIAEYAETDTVNVDSAAWADSSGYANTSYYSIRPNSNFISLTAQSARFGTGTDTTKINSNGIDVRQSGERITIGDGAAGITFGSAGDGQIAYINYESLGFNSNMSYHSTAGVIYPNGTRLRYGTNWVPATPHVLITGDSTNIITQGETGSFALDTLPRTNTDTLVVSGNAYINNPHGSYFRTSDLTISATQNIYYKITGFTNKKTDGLIVAGDSIQLPKGSFLINFTCSFSGLNNEIWELAVSKNGTPEQPTQLRYTSTSDVGNAGCPVYLESDGNDWVSFNIRNTTDNDDPTIKRFSAIITTMHLEL